MKIYLHLFTIQLMSRSLIIFFALNKLSILWKLFDALIVIMKIYKVWLKLDKLYLTCTSHSSLNFEQEGLYKISFSKTLHSSLSYIILGSWFSCVNFNKNYFLLFQTLFIYTPSIWSLYNFHISERNFLLDFFFQFLFNSFSVCLSKMNVVH